MVNEAVEVSKDWKSLLRISESSRFLIQLYFDFFFKCFLVGSWNIMLNFSTFSVGGCWGQPMLLFSKLVDETYIFLYVSQFKKHISIWDTLYFTIWVRRQSGYMSFWLCISWHFSNPFKRRSGHVDSNLSITSYDFDLGTK